MKRDFQVCPECRTKVLARPLVTKPTTSQNWSASTLSTTPTAPAFPPMSSTSNNQQTTGTQRGSNYFFGILFSVAILILMCATCGIGSRARYFVRRRNFQREVEAREWKEVSNTPRLHEVSFVNAGEDVRWRGVMPLSASYLCDKSDKPKSSEALNRTAPPPPPPSSTTSRSRTAKSHNRKNVSASDPEQPTAIRTLTLIVMPSFHRDRRLGVDADDQFIKHPTTMSSEIHIGVETLPWNKS